MRHSSLLRIDLLFEQFSHHCDLFCSLSLVSLSASIELIEPSLQLVVRDLMSALV